MPDGSLQSIPKSASQPRLPRIMEASVEPQPRGPDWMPITPKTGSLFHADSQPELNGQENIWQFMRANWLSNRVFKSYDDIVDHCCFAWNTLTDQPWKIMSIARRDWAHVGQSI